jgi:ATP-dependent DNA ligase
MKPPILPMLAKRVDHLPDGDGWIFEPKWDGFRALIFRSGDEILIQSRDGKSLNRYFPEVEKVLREHLPKDCTIDGELVIAGRFGLDFDALQLRIHPAASRVKLLSQQTPASVVFFDLLSLDQTDLRGEPFEMRREKLESLLSTLKAPIHLTPATRERTVAQGWFRRFEGAGLDGVMAKRATGTYESDKRVMLKIKHERDCDCVVAGFRWSKESEGTAIGSLLLGLYDENKVLQHVGVCSSFKLETRRSLVDFLAPYRKGALLDHPWSSPS